MRWLMCLSLFLLPCVSCFAEDVFRQKEKADAETQKLRDDLEIAKAEAKKLREALANTKAEFEILKAKLTVVYQENERLKAISDKNPPGCLISAINTAGSIITMRDNSTYEIAPNDRPKVARWSSTDIISFMGNHDWNNKKDGLTVYKMENLTKREAVHGKFLRHEK